MNIRPLAIVVAFLTSFPALAQAPAPLPPPNEAARNLAGVWELSNPDRDRRCQFTFRLDPAPPGRAVTLAPNCAAAFPDLAATAAWTLGTNDSLHLIDRQGALLLELTEVESGMYETTVAYSRLLLQTLAASGKDRITDDLFGEWVFSRSNRPICAITLGNTAHDADSFVLTVKPGCDPLIARFAPVSWKLDRSQFVMLNGRGESWRFEEGEPNAWSRIPAMRPPLVMVKP